jgi:hypothetical protein
MNNVVHVNFGGYKEQPTALAQAPAPARDGYMRRIEEVVIGEISNAEPGGEADRVTALNLARICMRNLPYSE